MEMDCEPSGFKAQETPNQGSWERSFPWAEYAASAHFGLPHLFGHPVLYDGLEHYLKMLSLLLQWFALHSQWRCRHAQEIFLYLLTKAGQNSLLAKASIPYEKVFSKNKTSKKHWILNRHITQSMLLLWDQNLSTRAQGWVIQNDLSLTCLCIHILVSKHNKKLSCPSPVKG